MGVLAAKRNAGRAALQQLVADFDPDEQGVWAQEELTVAACMAALHAKGKQEHADEATVNGIVASFCAQRGSQAGCVCVCVCVQDIEG